MEKRKSTMMKNWNKIQLVRISYKFGMKENERFQEDYFDKTFMQIQNYSVKNPFIR